MTAKDVYDIGMEELKKFSVEGLLPGLRAANSGAIEDVKNTNGCLYYQWSCALMSGLKPKQVVELGGAMGVWDICVLHSLSPHAKLFSVTLKEGGLEFSYVIDKYPNFIPCDEIHHYPYADVKVLPYIDSS